ncbi:transcriptional protein SWT1-like isoform X4 [Vespa mandarinia]|uniref:transcriptional protein SWT1-like isoform X4 n=1 Tax=Vespa mandarinia TaxID=7446 RepID=UPI001608B261|nr:transcriptional protein SWT1-like isoform X4 [Vespa mandarinia]
MRKHKLPKNWVVVGSKSHPDRVYYFNIKTNESSWKEPTTEGTKKASVNDGPKQKKRKTNEMSPIESRTSSDIEEGNDNKDIVRRKKLVAKRHFKATQEFDTIQMAEIKKKMQQRKAKSNSKSNSSTNSFTQINSPTKLYKSDEDKKTEIMTPQMRVIYEKLQKKNMNKKVSKQSQSLQNVKDIETVENIEHRVKVDKRKRRKREGVTKSSSSNQDTSACSSSHESNPTKNDIRCSSIKDTTEIKSERSSITKNILQNKKNSQYKSKETIIENKEYNNSINKKSGRVISKRNLAKDRMDKLKTTLNLQMKDQKNNNKSSQSNDKSLLAIIKDNEIPDIYKTSDMRYKNLRNRLLRNKIIPDENQLLASVKTNMQNQSLNALGENPVNESNNSSLYEEMDWEPMEDEKITFEVQAARIQLCVENAKNETLPIEGNILQFSSIPVQEEKKTLYIVVDTNVFLSNLDAIIKAMVTEFAKYDKPILVIPWTVIRELDYLKNDKFERKSIHLREKARKAINFLHDHFSVKHPRIVGQTLEDVKSNKEKFAIECPDDEILQACLQIRNAERTVIVSKEMKNLFGETWEKYTIIKPPWTILCVLKCAIKHWIAAISDAFDRQAENLLKELLEIFRTMPKGGRKLKDIAKVLEKSADLIQMIHVDKYSDLINRASSTIKNIKKRYQNYENEIRERKIQEEIGTENDVIQQKCRADRAFNYFNYIYSYARDIGGMAADIVNMPCSFCYEIPNPAPTVEYVKKIQPEIGQNVNHLLRILTEALEGMKDASIDHRTLIDLYHILTNFLPDRTITNTTDLCPLDVYCCLKEKEDVLKLGVRQLQELCTHYCRLVVATNCP